VPAELTDTLVSQRSGRKPIDELLNPIDRHAVGVVLEHPVDPAAPDGDPEGVLVAEVNEDDPALTGRLEHARVAE
jgi:hypothetical protein